MQKLVVPDKNIMLPKHTNPKVLMPKEGKPMAIESAKSVFKP